MDAVEFARKVLGKIDHEINALDGVILNGSMPDFTAYRAAVSTRDGLRKARVLCVDTLGERRDELSHGV